MQILDKLQSETAREYAYRVIKYNIITLQLAPGSMVSETELANELGVSRTPVREALIELSKYGVVNIYPQKGSSVSLIDSEKIEEARFLRLVLEKAVVELICDMDNVDFTALNENVELQKFYLNQNIPDKIFDLDNEFHKTLFKISNKMQIYDLIQDVGVHFDRFRSLSISPVRNINIVSDHEELYKALKNKYKALAIAITVEHLSRYQIDEAALRKEYSEYFS